MDVTLAHSLQGRKRCCGRRQTRATPTVSIRKGAQAMMRFPVRKQRFLLAASAAQFHRRPSNPGLGFAEKTQTYAQAVHESRHGASAETVSRYPETANKEL